MLYGYMLVNMENEILDCLMNIGDKIGFPFWISKMMMTNEF